MTEIGRTESLCPDCLTRLPAALVAEGETVRLVKTCQEHGEFSAVIWQGPPAYSSWVRPKIPFHPGTMTEDERGCPYSCGLCTRHGQRTCTALVEISSRCNLNCPVCFADSGGDSPDPSLAELATIFARIIAQTGGCNLQLSGGEPTVRADLVMVVEQAKAAGFPFIQLNTNGIMLAAEPSLAARLRAAGLDSVFLQFDGLNDAVYQRLRGKALLAQKKAAIQACADAGLGIVLVPTIVPGVNSGDVWSLVEFGLSLQPHVRGVHFQPISYFGRFPADFRPEHISLPELMAGLAKGSGGLIHPSDFQPPGCEHALCSFSARYLVEEDGRLTRLGGAGCDCRPQPAEAGALRAIAVTARSWRGQAQAGEGSGPAIDDLDRFLRRARSHSFTISAMAFQDVWSLDLERLQACCIHVAQADGRLIPFCSYNLTARNGRSLHRRRP